MWFGFNISFFLPGVILLIASIDDMRSRKIHNRLLIIMLIFVVPLVFLLNAWGLGMGEGLGEPGFSLTQGFKALMAGGFSASLALLFGIPLALARFIGGGDLKLLSLVALSLHWQDFIQIVIYSLPWAVVLGLVKIILDKKLKDFLFNLYFLITYRKTKGLKFHSIPFSVALFAAWFSFLTLKSLN